MAKYLPIQLGICIKGLANCETAHNAGTGTRQNKSFRFLFFLIVLLILASQRIETVFKNWVGRLPGVLEKWISDDVTTKRGAPPTMIEWLILAWVCGKV